MSGIKICGVFCVSPFSIDIGDLLPHKSLAFVRDVFSVFLVTWIKLCSMLAKQLVFSSSVFDSIWYYSVGSLVNLASDIHYLIYFRMMWFHHSLISNVHLKLVKTTVVSVNVLVYRISAFFIDFSNRFVLVLGGNYSWQDRYNCFGSGLSAVSWSFSSCCKKLLAIFIFHLVLFKHF